MIYPPTEQNSKYVFFSYGSVGFALSQTYCANSLLYSGSYPEELFAKKDHLYDETGLVLINLDKIIQDACKLKLDKELYQVLVWDSRALDAALKKELLPEKLWDAGPYWGFFFSRQAKMVSFKKESLKKISQGPKKALLNRGLEACLFTETGQICYVLNPLALIKNQSEGFKKHAHFIGR